MSLEPKPKPYMLNDEKRTVYLRNGDKPAVVTLQDGQQVQGKLGRFLLSSHLAESIIVSKGFEDIALPLHLVRRVDVQ